MAGPCARPPPQLGDDRKRRRSRRLVDEDDPRGVKPARRQGTRAGRSR
jgi:hypothetical protein